MISIYREKRIEKREYRQKVILFKCIKFIKSIPIEGIKKICYLIYLDFKLSFKNALIPILSNLGISFYEFKNNILKGKGFNSFYNNCKKRYLRFIKHTGAMKIDI